MEPTDYKLTNYTFNKQTFSPLCAQLKDDWVFMQKRLLAGPARVPAEWERQGDDFLMSPPKMHE